MTELPRPLTAVLVVLGPTGTGKSQVAIEVAQVLGGEIVGCDALQVYRGLDAGTAKPSEAERRAVRHHLVDCIDPRTDYTMADYVRAADGAIATIASRGRVPLVVGGAGLYLRGLLRGFVSAPPRDAELRARLLAIVERGGLERLRAWLRRHDPESARRIPVADVQRLVRAIEMVRIDGKAWGDRMRAEGTWATKEDRYRTVKIGLDMDRERHQDRLATRVDRFFESGLVDEVSALLRQGVPREANALKAIGYHEVVRAIEHGEEPRGVRDEVWRNTRRYARRQRTWFRSEPDVIWLDAARPRNALVARIVDLWHGRPATDGA